MNDCNGKRELVTRTRRRAALTSRTTTTNHIQQLCPMNDIAGSEALPRSRRGHQTNRSTALSTVSNGPNRYPILRTSWYRLRSPYASLPANLERVAKTWNRLAPSFGSQSLRSFFFKHGGTPTYMFTIKGILENWKRIWTRLKHPLQGKDKYVCMYVWSSHIAKYGSTG